MNICFVTMSGLFLQASAAPKLITQKACAISRLGHRVFIVTDDPREYYGIDGGRFVPYPFPRWCRLLHRTIQGRIERRLASHEIPAPERPQFHCCYDPGFALRVLYVAVRRSVDVLHAEKMGYAFPCALAGMARRVFVTMVEHDVEYQRLGETCDLTGHAARFLTRLERGACARTDSVVAVSDDDKKRLMEIGVDPRTITVIPHGLTLGDYGRGGRERIREKYGLGNAVVGILHGTFSYRPNGDALSAIAGEILPRMVREGVDIRFLMVGQNPPRDIASPRIIFTGGMFDQRELSAHIAAADIAILPIPTGGGTRMKILEYFATGVPVVSSAKGAEGLGVTHGGELLYAETPEEMVRNAMALLRDKELRARIVQNAFEFVRGRDWDLIAPRFVDLYARGIRRKRHGDPLRPDPS